jgi:predicted DNA-binding ribbon-helix-helix protein
LAGTRPDGAAGAARSPAKSKKTLRVGGVRTSVGLEEAFWACLAEVAAERRVRLAALVDEVAARPRAGTLASALRVFALEEARRGLGRAAAGPARRGVEPAEDG